jgi:hypothetical protein
LPRPGREGRPASLVRALFTSLEGR